MSIKRESELYLVSAPHVLPGFTILSFRKFNNISLFIAATMLTRPRRDLRANFVAAFTIKNASSALISETDTKASAFKKTRDICAGNAGKHFPKLKSWKNILFKCMDMVSRDILTSLISQSLKHL